MNNAVRMSKLIYIVDDEPCVAEMIACLLRFVDPSWQVMEFTSPAAALEAARKTPPHAVLSDQNMPEIPGLEFLDRFRGIAPQAVRLLISGAPSDIDKISVAHQYLMKPFQCEELERRIRLALDAQEQLDDPHLRDLLTSIQSFPVLPKVHEDLLRELGQDDLEFEKTADLLASDAGILTKLLQVANSPMFRGRETITDSRSALLLLGTRSVRALVMSLHVFSSYETLDFSELSVPAIWRHSLETARLAEELARNLGRDASHAAFFAGLMHDLGRLVLIENHRERYRQVCQTATREHRPLADVEQEVFQCPHTLLSSFILQLWGMPTEVVEAVKWHQTPWCSPRATLVTPTTALYVADILNQRRSPVAGFAIPELDLNYLAEMEVLEKWLAQDEPIRA